MSLPEIKRRARGGEPAAVRVYPARAYGLQLWLFLWLFLGIFSSLSLALLAYLFGWIISFGLGVLIVITLFFILPNIRWPYINLGLAATVSPYIEWCLRTFYIIGKYPERFVSIFFGDKDTPLRINSKEELIEILKYNAKNFDYISKDELKIAEHALVYGEKMVGDHMTPLNTVYFIKSDEQLTPVVLGELHDSGHSRFPVYESTNQNVIGTLFIKDALRLKTPKTAESIMRREVYYINEQQTLGEALRAFIKTKHHMFVVVNEFEDVVGVLTIEDVIEQIIGKPILDEFDQYDDLRAVALEVARKKQDDHEPEHV